MRTICCCILLFYLLGCQGTQELFLSPLRVEKVTDGDTLTLSSGEKLRLIGIDTPEITTKERGQFRYNPQPFALEAKNLVQQLAEGQKVRIEYDLVRRDVYGRSLGYCFIQGKSGEVFLNKQLLEEGFAVLLTIPPNIKYADTFVEAQTNARQKKKGIWGTYEAVHAQDAHRFINQIRRVEGVILDGYCDKKKIYLLFDTSAKQSTKIIIYKNALESFTRQHIDPLSYYKGKRVEVTGRIRKQGGVSIGVSSPSQIFLKE